MNGRFKRMLEPGERILVRSTDGKTTWYLAGAFILLAGLIWVRTLWGGEFLGFRFWIVPLAFMISAPLVTAAAWLSTRWKWVITDRRVLKRYGKFSPEIAEMRHENVEEVRLRDKALSIHGRDYRWELEISRGFCRADILYDLFGARLGAARRHHGGPVPMQDGARARPEHIGLCIPDVSLGTKEGLGRLFRQQSHPPLDEFV